jgi:CubicO group peptidase (beta-lactamase class C family)
MQVLPNGYALLKLHNIHTLNNPRGRGDYKSMKKSRNVLPFLLCIVFTHFSSCSIIPKLTPTQSNSLDYWPTDGWLSSTPEEQGMDSEILVEMLKLIRDQDYQIDSLTVVRNGYMVLDVTIYPFTPETKHFIHSCTKSIISALIGIAIDQGKIESVEVPMLDFFPSRQAANLDAQKEALSLEDLLTMSTGFRCRDSYLYRWEGLHEMRASEDWIQYMLDLPMQETPGTRFEYCNGASFLLFAIIQDATGVSAEEFAQENLFTPLGISDYHWPANPQGISIGWGELNLRPHDMAKIGYLYLKEGIWEGKQILPTGWVKESTRKHTSATLEDGYGYQWWIHEAGFYLALGYAGQFIYVLPDKNLVVVFTSDLEERDFYVPQNLLMEFIIPSAHSSDTLPANPDGENLLQSYTEKLSNP